MKYKLFKKVTKVEEIDSVLLAILANSLDYHCDSILETEDRIIVRYLKKTFPKPEEITVLRPFNITADTILYIHSSKKDHTFTKICIYKLEELNDEKDIQKKN